MILNLNPVNFEEISAQELPGKWPELARNGFYPDLINRARSFALAGKELANQCSEPLKQDILMVTRETLEITSKGFYEPFRVEDFEPKVSDQYLIFKWKYLEALQKLSSEFGNSGYDRVGSSVWRSLAFLGCRSNPFNQETILNCKDDLARVKIPWWFADAVLHAIGKPYGFKHHVDTRIYEYTGMILEHSCDCSHAVQEPLGGGVSCLLREEDFPERTNALLSHLFSEALLIGGLKMPFKMGFSLDVEKTFLAFA